MDTSGSTPRGVPVGGLWVTASTCRTGRPVSKLPVKPHERGSATIWMLGLSLLAPVIRGTWLSTSGGDWLLQRELAAVADSAAIAAASGIDEDHIPSGWGSVVLNSRIAPAIWR